MVGADPTGFTERTWGRVGQVRRPLVLLVTALLVASLAACSGGDGDGGGDAAPGTGGATSAPPTTEATTTTAPPPPELPRGGRTLFPDHRVVAYYGNAESSALGVLGEVPPEEAAARVDQAAAPFDRPDRPVLPAMELIVTVAQASPGADGDYSSTTPMDLVRRWHFAARDAGMLLILDFQPGRSDFLPQVQQFEELIREPDVGVALDSEWHMAPDEVPGQVIGSVDAAQVNEVSAWLADIVAEEDLPEKVFLLHQFTESMITNRDQVVDRPGLATVFHIDGFGGQEIKVRKYAALQVEPPFHNALKLFYDEDIDIFTPDQVLGIDPDIDLVTYQ